MKKLSCILCLCVSAIAAARAEPTTVAVNITELRPYNIEGTTAGSAVFVAVDLVSACDTNVYKIDLRFAGSREVYAAVLSAFLTGKKVRIEVVNSGCTGWGSSIQSVYVQQ
jgi:hypothetical protein